MKELPVDRMDDDLWHRVLAGDIAAFDELMRRHGKALYRYGMKFTADAELVKDSIQDVFLEVWEKRAQVNREIPPKPYLMASLRRRIHRMGKLSLKEPGGFDEFDESGFDFEFSIEQKIIQDEFTLQQAEQVRLLLNQLPRRQKEVIYLKFFSGLSRDDIAEVMSVAPQTVSNQLQNALKWLQVNWKLVIKVFLVSFSG